MTGRGISRPRGTGLAEPTKQSAERSKQSAERSKLNAERSKLNAERSARILELKAKLGDDEYMYGAILRIATVLSARFTEGYFDVGRSAK